jgi:GGDEF domain-containing protein
MLTRPAPTLAATPAAAHAVYNDGLSGLSRCARLRAALDGALASSEPAALVYAIPHDIALVADGLGPAAVDTLLDLIGRRLAGLAGPRDSVARTADDASCWSSATSGARP